MNRILVLAVVVLATLVAGANVPSTADPAQAAGLSIRGTVWEDRNADGLRQPDEPPVASISMQLGRIDAYGVPRYTDDRGIDIYRGADGRLVRTDEFGNYEFPGLEAGEYVVRLTPAGAGIPFFLTHPHRQATGSFARSVSLTAGPLTGIDFGLHRLQSIPEFSGEAWLDAREVTISLQVRAFIDGTDCTTNPPFILPPHVARYAIGVASEALIPGCGEPGDTISLTINGRPANETAVWEHPQTNVARGGFTLTAGEPFAVYELRMVGDDGLPIFVPEAVVEAVIDGVVCGRSELYGQGGTAHRVVIKSHEGGGCGYEGAPISFVLAGRVVGESKWHAGMHEGPTIRIGRGSLNPPVEHPQAPEPDRDAPPAAPQGSCCGPRAGSVIQPPSVGDGGLLGR